jgi:hypothetical protein
MNRAGQRDRFLWSERHGRVVSHDPLVAHWGFRVTVPLQFFAPQV